MNAPDRRGPADAEGVARLQEPILRFAMRLVGAARAADVVSSTLLVLCEKRAQGFSPRDPRAFAFDVAWRKARRPNAPRP